MSESTLLILFGIGFIVFSVIGLKRSYHAYKNQPDGINIGLFYNNIAGIVFGAILLIRYLLRYI